MCSHQRQTACRVAALHPQQLAHVHFPQRERQQGRRHAQASHPIPCCIDAPAGGVMMTLESIDPLSQCQRFVRA